jgi:hypothetical protein
MVAGLPLPCIKGGALGYKSTGRSRIYDSKTINTIDLPSCLYAPPVNLDSNYYQNTSFTMRLTTAECEKHLVQAIDFYYFYNRSLL